MPMSDTNNVKLGVCTITFDGVDLGLTKGGVEVDVKTESKKVQVDQFGNSTVNEYITGRECTVKVPLAETTIEQIARIMPGAVLTQSGATAAQGTVTFATTPPVNSDVVTVNGVAFTFKTVPAGVNDMAIPATINAAATALRDAINASIDPLVSRVTATAAAGVVTIKADDAGTAGNAITLVKTGTNITVSGATLTGGADATKKKVVVPNGIGISLLQMAKKLVLHPIANLPTNRSEDFTVPLAMTPGDMNYSFKLDEERIFTTTFTAYPDPVSKTLYIVGDETAS